MTNKTVDIQASDKPGYCITDTTGEVVTLQFADGPHSLNRALVAHLGGPAEVRKYAGDAKNLTHSEFIKRFWTTVEKTAVNSAVNNMINNHLAGRRFG